MTAELIIPLVIVCAALLALGVMTTISRRREQPTAGICGTHNKPTKDIR
jgi:hypothetical protein